MRETVKILKPHFYDSYSGEKNAMWYNKYINETIVIEDDDIKFWDNYDDYMLPVTWVIS